MEQIGEVVELRGRWALVRIQRASSCGENCAQCSGECKPTSSVIKATNGICARVGDMVKIQMSSPAFLLLSFIGYILPIIICICTYFGAKAVFKSTVVADALAVLSIILVLLVFYILDKLPRKATVFSSRIIKIIR